MLLSLDLPEEIIRQLQTVEDRNGFVSHAILAALAQHRLKTTSKSLASGKPQGHVFNILALLDSTEFNAIPFGDPVEIEKTIRTNRNEWDDK